MTVSTEDFRWTYTSTGGTTYQYLNKILTQDDLTVYVAGTLQTIGTHYTVDGVGDDAGGNIEFLAAPAAGATVLITKDGITFTQDHDYTENDPFPAASHEDALDKQTNLAQKIWDYVRRSIKVAITSTLTDLELPEPTAGAYLGWNDTGTGFSNLIPTALGVISDDAYSSVAWDGATTVAPSKNSVRDKVELIETEIGTLTANALGIYNLGISASVASSALTVFLKGNDGNDPSSTNPVIVGFRSSTIASGLAVYRTITSGVSLTLPSGGTLGFTSAETGRVYVWLLDNAGTCELALSRTSDIHNENLLSTTYAIAATSDFSTALYSASARASVPIKCIGYLEITTGATAGEWGTSPSKIQPILPGVKRTGDIVQEVISVSGASSSGTTVMPFDNTTPQITEGVEFMTKSITPTSAYNKLRIEHRGIYDHNAGTQIVVALFQDSTATALRTCTGRNAAGYQLNIPLYHEMTAGTTLPTTFRIRAGSPDAGTTTFNIGAYFNNTLDSYLKITEIAA